MGYEELMAWMDSHNRWIPDCEMFAELHLGDEKLTEGKGYIAEEPTDQDLIDEIPRTLREALGLGPEDLNAY